MVTAIVLAAGLSARMGEANKLLLPLGGKTVIETVVQNIIDAGIEEVIVVTGHEAEAVKKVLVNLPVQTIHNPDYAKGMTTSIQLGVSMARGSGYMICLSDMPLITPQDYALLKRIFDDQRIINQQCIAIPKFLEEKGNPVIFSSHYKSAILNHLEMEGCKEIIQSNKKNICWIEMSNENILKDMDTVSDYDKIKQLSSPNGVTSPVGRVGR
ncbi:MAG TPA: nucleotidyltransferase family protein [Segetibacter sp.]